MQALAIGAALFGCISLPLLMLTLAATVRS